jgi:tRNA threonylcarbamoyladenosine biosynthesis protein TsaB
MSHSSILLIDTSASRCAVGLAANVLHQRFGTEERKSAQNLLPLVAEVTQSAEIALKDLSAIAVMAGPGSFTGLRIGIGVAQALAMANRTPGIVLSNLAVLALAAVEVTEGDTFFVALPAREGEFYFAVYVSDDVLGVRLLGKEQVASPDQLLFPEKVNEAVLLGDVWCSEENLRLRAEACTERVSYFKSSVSLKAMAQLAERRLSAGLVGDASSLKPNYVKEQLEY